MELLKEFTIKHSRWAVLFSYHYHFISGTCHHLDRHHGTSKYYQNDQTNLKQYSSGTSFSLLILFISNISIYNFQNKPASLFSFTTQSLKTFFFFCQLIFYKQECTELEMWETMMYHLLKDKCVYSPPLTILPLMQSQDVVRWCQRDEGRATLGYSLAPAKSLPHTPDTVLYLLSFLLDPTLRLLREIK